MSPREIAERIINQNEFKQEEFMWLVHNSETLARAYLELEKKHRMLNNAIAIASWNINDYVKQFAKDIIEHSKSDSEITKLKEENENYKIVSNGLSSLNETLSKDLKMCREIGVEMQREVNRKLSVENEKLKKSREVLRSACEFYGNWVNSPDGIIHKSDCETIFVHEPLEKDKNGIVVAGKKAREALKADDELMK